MKKVTEKDLPKIKNSLLTGDKSKDMPFGLQVRIDGINASIFENVADGYYADEKLVILFEEKHPIYGDFFTTKYYFIEEPGKINWGQDDGFFIVERIEAE